MKRTSKIKPNQLMFSKLDTTFNLEDKYDDLDFINRKKELVLLDYESLFQVYGREFTIIYSFRGWSVTLLTAYFGFLFTTRPIADQLINIPGFFIIIAFFILEIAERSVMRRLIKEVRYIESIFMLQSPKDFKKQITEYIFRDIRDENLTIKIKVRDLLLSIFNLQVIIWNAFLLGAYYIMIYILPLINSNQININIDK